MFSVQTAHFTKILLAPLFTPAIFWTKPVNSLWSCSELFLLDIKPLFIVLLTSFLQFAQRQLRHLNPEDIFGKLKRKTLCLSQENKEGSPLFEQGWGGCLKYWCCYKRPGDRMVFHLCWCLSFPLFSHETSLFISAGGSLHGADEGSENEQWTLWTGEELSRLSSAQDCWL